MNPPDVNSVTGRHDSVLRVLRARIAHQILAGRRISLSTGSLTSWTAARMHVLHVGEASATNRPCCTTSRLDAVSRHRMELMLVAFQMILLLFLRETPLALILRTHQDQAAELSTCAILVPGRSAQKPDCSATSWSTMLRRNKTPKQTSPVERRGRKGTPR